MALLRDPTRDLDCNFLTSRQLSIKHRSESTFSYLLAEILACTPYLSQCKALGVGLKALLLVDFLPFKHADRCIQVKVRIFGAQTLVYHVPHNTQRLTDRLYLDWFEPVPDWYYLTLIPHGSIY
jgi:hypothetical protein